MMSTLGAIGLGYLLDLIFGDPKGLPHPIRFIGWMIENIEKLLGDQRHKSTRVQFLGGMCLSIVVVGISFLIPWLILYYLVQISGIAAFIVESFMCYQILAVRSLKSESMKVHSELIKLDLVGARLKLSYIVGRDTQNLTREQVAKGAVETVAENCSDGVVAPLIFMLIGGAPLGFLYKAVNTLDSMIGYKNERYLYFGRFAAKLDDALNLIPSRICAWLMIVASWLCGFDAKNAIKIYKRDRFNHASPNSAQTESVCAGALGIQLAGNSHYFGKLVEKPSIGDNDRPISPEDIAKACKLLYWTGALALILGCSLRFLIILGGS